MNRSRLRLFAAVFAALFPAAAPAQEIAHLAPQFFISHSLGNFPNIPYVWPLDPLVYPNTFFVVGRGVSNDLPLDVRAVNFRGSVSLAAYPIVATAGAAWPRLEVIPSRVRLYGRFPEEGVDFHILAKPAPPYEAILEPSSFARPVLRVTSPSDPRATDSPTFATRTFLARIKGEADKTGETAESHAVFSVIDLATDITTPRCPALFSPDLPEVLPLETMLRGLFATKAADPTRTRFSIGVGLTQTKGLGYQLDISRSSTAIGPDETIVTFVNASSDTKSLFTYDGNNCGAVPPGAPYQNLILNAGDTGTLRINNLHATTIALSSPWQHYAVFSDPNFWTLFGGRHVTITTVGN